MNFSDDKAINLHMYFMVNHDVLVLSQNSGKPNLQIIGILVPKMYARIFFFFSGNSSYGYRIFIQLLVYTKPSIALTKTQQVCYTLMYNSKMLLYRVGILP